MTDHRPAGQHRKATPPSPPSAYDRAVDGIEANPLAILVGGIAVGALAGALIPRSARERELLAPVGKRLGSGARAAFEAAKEAGQAELESRGLTPDAGREQVRTLLKGFGQALSNAGTAAAKSAAGAATGHGQA